MLSYLMTRYEVTSNFAVDTQLYFSKNISCEKAVVYESKFI